MKIRVPRRRGSRADRCNGSELIEFTLSFMPMLIMVFFILDVSWAIFAKSTLEYSVRTGVRYGVTVTGTQAGGSDLTTLVKNKVQANSMGLLRDTSKIFVHYFQPPDPGSAAAATDVSTQIYGNSPGNILQISIQNFTLVPLAPHFFGWNQAAGYGATPIGAMAADLIEPSSDLPRIGTAP